MALEEIGRKILKLGIGGGVYYARGGILCRWWYFVPGVV